MLEETDSPAILIAQIPAVNLQTKYYWERTGHLISGYHYFRLRMIDIHSKSFDGNVIIIKKGKTDLILSWVKDEFYSKAGQILIQSALPKELTYEIISVNGQVVRKGNLLVQKGKSLVSASTELLPAGFYQFLVMDENGSTFRLVFMKE